MSVLTYTHTDIHRDIHKYIHTHIHTHTQTHTQAYGLCNTHATQSQSSHTAKIMLHEHVNITTVMFIE